MGLIYRYKQLKAMPPEERKQAVPRVAILGGKAAPGYDMAKRIIKLVRGWCGFVWCWIIK
jgi:starch phosphorylase